MGLGGINIGMTALQAQRQGLDTAGQNIANANTEGYSRQRVRLSALGAPTRPAYFSQFISSGSGVRVDGIDRASDRFLQVRTLQEHALDSSLQQTKSILNRVELAFDEPSDEGLQNQLADFWSAWDDVANNPADLATRTQLLQKAQSQADHERQERCEGEPPDPHRHGQRDESDGAGCCDRSHGGTSLDVELRAHSGH